MSKGVGDPFQAEGIVQRPEGWNEPDTSVEPKGQGVWSVDSK